MKLIGNLLLTISLVTAMLSAATAYLAPVSLSDDAFRVGEDDFARLAGGAGITPITDEMRADVRREYDRGEITAEQYTVQRRTPGPLIASDLDTDGTMVTPERLEELRATNANAIQLKKFSFSRWKYWWVFALSSVGLFVGSMMVRAATKAEIEAAAPKEGAPEEESPEAALAAIGGILEGLARDLPITANEDDRLHMIIERLDEAMKLHIMPFIDARPALVNKLHLGGYAELMDRFAAMERQVNRAWSAAADGVYEESIDCIHKALDLHAETLTKM